MKPTRHQLTRISLKSGQSQITLPCISIISKMIDRVVVVKGQSKSLSKTVEVYKKGL